MDDDKLKHSYVVACKMIELGKERKLSDESLEELFMLGFIHDIGYQFGNWLTKNWRETLIKFRLCYHQSIILSHRI